MPGVADPTVSVEVPLPPDVIETLAGLTEDVRLADDTDPARLTVPAKPPRLVRRMVEVELLPVDALIAVGVAEIEKSGTLTLTVSLCANPEIVAVTAIA